MEWSGEKVIELIEEVKGRPCLWNPSDPDRKNRRKQEHTWMEIGNGMYLTASELKTKWKNVVQSYRGYRRRIIKRKNSVVGKTDLYIPSWFAYDILDSFLHDTYTPASTVDAVSTSWCIYLFKYFKLTIEIIIEELILPKNLSKV